MEVRPYDAARDREALWALKRAFELELGGGADDDAKAEAYAGKLTEAYRERYLDWVANSVAEAPECVSVAAPDGGASAGRGESDGELVGYAFLLPASLAMIWDAAVLNEIYVAPDHRASGLADQLLDAVLDVAEDQPLPMDRIVLDVAPSNDRAVAFYERHGFEPWGDLVAREL